jgi:hypothetical protein
MLDRAFTPKKPVTFDITEMKKEIAPIEKQITYNTTSTAINKRNGMHLADLLETELKFRSSLTEIGFPFRAICAFYFFFPFLVPVQY